MRSVLAQTADMSTDEPRNQVHLIGRLGTQVRERQLPSGDILVAFDVVVPRKKPIRATKVDAIPCQVSTAALRSRVLRLEAGVVIAVEGSLQRRFWRSPSGLGSALEVHVTRLRVQPRS
jgi:single-strand DNA-binding protein